MAKTMYFLDCCSASVECYLLFIRRSWYIYYSN